MRSIPERQQGDASDTVSPTKTIQTNALPPRRHPDPVPFRSPDATKPRRQRGFGERTDCADEGLARRGSDTAWAGVWQSGSV